MSAYAIKFKYIALPFIYIAVGTVGTLALMRWLALEYDFVNVKDEVWSVWLPFLFPWIPISIWLRPRLRILTFSDREPQRRFVFQFTAAFAICATSMVTHAYLRTAIGELFAAKTAAEIETTAKTQFYTIESFQVVHAAARWYTDVRVTGRYHEHLDLEFFYACPISDSHQLDPAKSYEWWYGIKYREQLNNRSSDDVKETMYNLFVESSLRKARTHQYKEVTYFERMPNSEDRDNFLLAIANEGESKVDNTNEILEAQREPFEERNGNTFFWIFGSFAIGLTVFLLLLLWPDYSASQLKRHRSGKKLKTVDLFGSLQLLIPRYPHTASSIILDLNILVFLIMIFSGIHFLYPKAAELLEWGGLRKFETLNGDWWRLITSTFLHAGAVHLIMNLAGLVLAAVFLEPRIGSVRFSIIYILSGLGGGITTLMWHDDNVSIGASGAIFGLFGAVLALLHTNTFEKYERQSLLSLFGIYAGISLIAGLVGNVNNAAHVGGMITGALVALFLHKVMEEQQEPTKRKKKAVADKDGK
jgi:rhomboid protease GluP